ncbi:tyrosine-type recombinase/integrase [Acidithiobacillus ferrianus]|uniref:tyrosine-type recombinase/integrase n=1 Tax=Acidithiobacillus ferrianus TaxID=2678518 RepID=UPI0023B21D8A|nr:tyrosine-type recombinase/integrase [Acidithiobacillus ferrianus]
MAAVKTGRKRQGAIEAETVIPVVPGQGELFGGVVEIVTVTAAPESVACGSAVSSPDSPPAGLSPVGSPSAGQDLLPVAVATPKKRQRASEGERKHLTLLEVDRLLAATKDNPRTGLRDRCLILLMFRHGLRVTEACAMRMDQVDLESKILQVQRLKGGLSTTQPLRTEEIRLLKGWMAERERRLRQWRKQGGAGAALDRQALFLSTRGVALSRKTFWALLRRYGELAGLALPPHPHMLRHACGFALADQGADTRLIQDYLGHRNIQHTVRYTATNPVRFEKLWR